MLSTLVIGLAAFAAAPDGSADADRSAYEAAAAAAGRDPEAQVRLALWCEAHGMPAERLKHLTRAVLLAPDNARARGLLGQVQRDGKWMRPQDVARAIEQSPDQKALIDEYFARRVKAKDDADDQYKLALWCEEHGLTQPMVAHLRRTLQLDASREGAWRRLGFKKVGGRWVNPEVEDLARAEREAQEKADREWKPRLERLRLQVEGKGDARRDRAWAELKTIVDPLAVPSVFQVFLRSDDERRQRVGVDVLSRIESPSASVALALAAVFSPHAEVRSTAASLVQRRDPREYAGVLAKLIRDEIKYKVKPVEGPGSQGRLIIDGKDANVTRLYTPADRVSDVLGPGDRMRYNEYGERVVERLVGSFWGGRTSLTALLAIGGGVFPLAAMPAPNGGGVGPYVPLVGIDPALTAAALQNVAPARQNFGRMLSSIGVPPSQATTLANRIVQPPAGVTSGPPTMWPKYLSAVNANPLYNVYQDLPVDRMAAEARLSAAAAREQLAADVAQIEAYNAPVREVNERTVAVLKEASGRDLGADRDRWMDWFIDLQGYGQPIRSESQPPATIVEEVPIAYQPQTGPTPVAEIAALYRIGPSCFAGGTPVRTIQGDRPIETIRPGDLVLSQDTTTGKLSYQPVVEALHNPPNWTYRIDLGGGESVHPTGIHRFWKAGQGWVMAREIKAGDRLRTVGGVVEVVSAEKEKVQPVFNLLLSGGDNYCVGGLGLVAHDNGFVEPVARPFDGVPTTAELASAKP